MFGIILFSIVCEKVWCIFLNLCIIFGFWIWCKKFCLWLRLTSEGREASHHSAFMGNCPSISYLCKTHSPRNAFFFFFPGMAKRNENAG